MTKFNAAFWKWFGDSKVVDGRGRPLVVYHGTHSDIGEFKLNSRKNQAVLLSEGFFFSTSKTASAYASWGEGGNVMPVYLSLQDPLIVDDPESGISRYAANYYDLAGKDLQKSARSAGHDGIIVRAHRKKDRTTYVAFYPEQVKSAIGNDGSWDADDPDIRSNPENFTTLYHGTTIKNAAKIKSTGVLKPRTDGGNWSTGIFGGSPSCKDRVYLTSNMDKAIWYGKRISDSLGLKGYAVATVEIDPQDLIPDEDTVAEFIFGNRSKFSSLMWSLMEDFTGLSEDEVMLGINESGSDSYVAGLLCDFTDYLIVNASASDLKKILEHSDTASIEGNAPVVSVEVFNDA